MKCHYKISSPLSNCNEISAYSFPSFKLLEGVIVNAYLNTWSEIHFLNEKHFMMKTLPFPSPHVSVDQFSNASFLNQILSVGKFDEVTYFLLLAY